MSLAPLTTGPGRGPEGVDILLAMTSPYVITVALLVCVVGSGACFGFPLNGWGNGAYRLGGDDRPGLLACCLAL